MILRPYQDTLMSSARGSLARVRHTLIVLSTGGGKTAIAAFMAWAASNKDKVIMFCCHRDFLLEQTAETFKEVGLHYTFVASGYQYNPSCNVVIASMDTLKRRKEKIRCPDILIVDEAAHAAAAGWAKVIEYYQAAGCFTVGLTACPERLGGAGLGPWFKEIVEGPPMAWLIENGYLSKYKMFAPSSPDLTGVHTQRGDYVAAEIDHAMNKPSITGNAVSEYKKVAAGKQAVAFCCSILHSHNVCAEFKEQGFSAVHIGADTNKNDRREMLRDFKAGKIKVLTSVDIFSEGFDLPVVEYGAMLRPTRSLSIYMQQCGRLLRAAPGKEFAYIADHAGNCGRRLPNGDFVEHHGFPDKVREWTLEDRIKRSGKGGEKTIPVRQCPSCYRVFAPAPICPECRFVFPIQYRTVDEIEGELAELQADSIRRHQQMSQGMAKTKNELVKQGMARGMTEWKASLRADHIIRGRKQKEENKKAEKAARQHPRMI